MLLIKKDELIIKKSRFIGYYYKLDNIDEINTIIDNLKKEHKKAKHIPYAYKINNIVKKSDDKEPNGTAGNPLLNIIELKQLNNTIILVVRYFGGIKLGAGPLTRAYASIANEVTKEK